MIRIFSKQNKKKYKKQQILKALKFSYINRKKKLKIKKVFFYAKNISKQVLNIKNFNINWLLKQ